MPGTSPFLTMSTVRDASLVPKRFAKDSDQVTAGVFAIKEGSKPALVRGTGLRRTGRNRLTRPSFQRTVPRTWLDRGVFGGYISGIYGHFLLESLGRLWMPGVDDQAPVVWISGKIKELHPWMNELLDLLGITAERVLVSSKTKAVGVRELLVPEAGASVNEFFHPWLARRLAIRPWEPDGSRIWLSRAGLETPTLAEEETIESRLRDLGWTVIRPETMSITAQLDALASARQIAGLEGSAFHSLVLIKGFGGRVDLFNRHNRVTYDIIAERLGLDQRRHDLPGAAVVEGTRGQKVQYAGVDVDALVRQLSD